MIVEGSLPKRYWHCRSCRRPWSWLGCCVPASGPIFELAGPAPKRLRTFQAGNDSTGKRYCHSFCSHCQRCWNPNSVATGPGDYPHHICGLGNTPSSRHYGYSTWYETTHEPINKASPIPPPHPCLRDTNRQTCLLLE